MALSSASSFSKRRRVRGAMVAVIPPPSPSAMSLMKDLAQLAQEISMYDRPKARQKRNCSHLIQRVKLLAPAFEEIRDCSPPLPPSALLAFRDLYGLLQRAKLLLEDCREGSCMWLLLDRDSIAQQFQELSQDMAINLRRLPLSILEISVELKEQVELVRLQTERAKQYLDSTEEKLQEELLTLFETFKRRKPLDANRLRAMLADLQLASSEDCEREMRCLKEEIKAQSSSEDFVGISSTLESLLSFVRSCQRLLYGPCFTDSTHAFAESRSAAASSPTAVDNATREASTMILPDEFKCPISLELMKDPVIISSGQTYDRSSISRWIAAGHCTCPKSGQKLIHLNLIPNYALRSLINQWCEEHKVYSDPPDGANRVTIAPADQSFCSAESIEATKNTAAFLVGKLATGSPEIQRQVAYELRLLAKTGMDNRKCIAEVGAIPFLVPLLSSKDAKAQEHAVTALLNLSIFDNNKTLIMAAGALDPVLQVLNAGSSMEARENAAATVFSLSVVDEFKVTIGNTRIAIPALVKLLREGTEQGKKDAATTLFNLSLYAGNKARVVSAGAVAVLIHLLKDGGSEITDDSLAVLALLAGCAEGLAAIRSASALPVLINLLRNAGSSRAKENSIGVLLALCRNGGDYIIACILQIPDAVPSLQTLILTGTPRGKRKASSLLKLLHNVDPFLTPLQQAQ
ncbi:hypothetical protein O6H91_05G008600 [Diphasiastrum complanatum]|uniref:Uncharacterized protein n=1 Tax=Diphasiastrum complanatum TaxID=34168 RepID=A0ACC2DKE2_DIPCM|nr:hypothetical protein O6H91_05G008600 [Diphasiastrum complanatum]